MYLSRLPLNTPSHVTEVAGEWRAERA
jgi:hypothetical protein